MVNGASKDGDVGDGLRQPLAGFEAKCSPRSRQRADTGERLPMRHVGKTP